MQIKNAVRFSLFMANPFNFFKKKFILLVILLVSSTSIIENRLKKKDKSVNIR